MPRTRKSSPVTRQQTKTPAHDPCTVDKAIAKATKANDKEIEKRDGMVAAWSAKAEALGNLLLSNASVTRRAVTDQLASLGSIGTNELMNVGMRAMAEWSKETEGEKGWWYRNVAYTQSLPGLLGSVVYLADVLLQKSKEDKAIEAIKAGKDPDARPFLPSDLRLGFSKWALMLSNLGLSNFVRALRYSYAENIDEQRIKSETIGQQDDRLKAAQAEKEEQRRLLEESRKEVEKLTAELRQARATGR